MLWVCTFAFIFMVHRENQAQIPIKDLVILPPDGIDFDIISPLPLVSITQSYDIILIGVDGKEARLNFGKEVTYSGDLPINEAAKLFFDTFNNICQEERLR